MAKLLGLLRVVHWPAHPSHLPTSPRPLGTQGGQQPAQPRYTNYWALLTHKWHSRNQHSPGTPMSALREHGNNMTRSTGRSSRQNAATQCSMRRKERVTIQGPVKEQQPDVMSHRGYWLLAGAVLPCGLGSFLGEHTGGQAARPAVWSPWCLQSRILFVKPSECHCRRRCKPVVSPQCKSAGHPTRHP